MELAKEAYQALEDIVGPEWITQDPAILDTYNQVFGNKVFFDEKWSRRPAGVVLPGSAEECQAIVRVCNKYKVKFKAFCSGFEHVALNCEKEDTILLDLKRMNRILEIDVKNMRVVVEPYVNLYRLQLELAKHGLFTSSISAGPTGNLVATLNHGGVGPTQVFTGCQERGILGLEWILPTGEMVHLGSGEAGNDWYSADGPGFSLRGIFRGGAGSNGGLGIITKASAKIFPWYGPTEWKMKGGGDTGNLPSLKYLEEVPDGYELHNVTLKDRDTLFDFMVEVAQAEIAFVDTTYWGGLLPTEGNDELVEAVSNVPPGLGEKFDNTSSVVLHWHSARQKEYRKKVFDKICKKYDAEEMPLINNPDVHAINFQDMAWCLFTVREAFRLTGEMFVGPALDGSLVTVKKANDEGLKVFDEYYENGTLADLGRRNVTYFSCYENFTTGFHIETVGFYDPYDPESLKGARELFGNAFNNPDGPFRRFGVPSIGGCFSIESVTHIHERWGPLYDNYDLWLQKIKRMMDPECLSDWSGYVPPEYPGSSEK